MSESLHSLYLSGYSEQFRYDVITSGIKAYEQQCAKSDAGIIPLHRPRNFNQEERRRKKLLSKTSWYRPASAVGFFPGTPGRVFANKVQNIVDEEGQRLDLKIKIIESGGVSLKSKLVKNDLSGCLFPDCKLCDDDQKGGSHTRRGCVYQGQCVECRNDGVNATYHGELMTYLK